VLAILVAAGLSTLAVSDLLRHRNATIRAASGILVVLSPLLLSSVFLTALSVSRSLPTAAHAAAHSSGTPRANAAGVVLWLVFDEMDEELAFERRPASVRMPAFDRLRSESIVASDVRQVADRTLRAVPAMTVGRTVLKADPAGRSALMLNFDSSSPAVLWKDVPNVFSEAKRLGRSTAIVGWYHPCCREFGGETACCVSSPHSGGEPPTVWRQYALSLGASALIGAQAVHGLGIALLERSDLLGTLKAQSDVIRSAHAAQVRSLREALLRAVGDPRIDFVYAHLPVPHAPGLGTPSGREPDYLDNLEIADSVLADVRLALEASGRWADAAMLITADHGYRPDLWAAPFASARVTRLLAGTRGGRVPFIVKVPRYSGAVRFDWSLSAIAAHDVVVGMLNGSLKTPDSVLAVLEKLSASGGSRQ